MTRHRQRDGRSDWAEFSGKRKRDTRAALAELHRRDCEHCDGTGVVYGKACGPCGGLGLAPLTAGQSALIEAAGPATKQKPRAKPIQHERHEMESLALMIAYGPQDRNPVPPWWGAGFQRWEARTVHDGETLQSWREGASAGWPDCGIFVRTVDGIFLNAACEMKTEADRPKRSMPHYWWLGNWPGEQQSWHGLKREQHRWLSHLEANGWRTLVAYSAQEAYEWFDALAGQRPPPGKGTDLVTRATARPRWCCDREICGIQQGGYCDAPDCPVFGRRGTE